MTGIARRSRLIGCVTYYLSVAPELAKPRAAIDKLASEIPRRPDHVGACKERPADNPRPTFVHNRGEFLQPTERVEPAVLSMLPGMASGLAAQPAGTCAVAGLGIEPAYRAAWW